MKKLILFSGGLDSATLLAQEADADTFALFFNYGQKAFTAEYQAVKAFTEQYHVQLICKNITEIFCESDCTLLNKKVEKPVTYTHTELEFRNGVFLSCAISTAMQLFPTEEVSIMLGLIQIQMPYADCSATFIQLYDQLAQVCSNNKISVKAPFLDLGKDKVLSLARTLNLEVNKTWSCYDGQTQPCGLCDACIDRKILGVL